MVKNTLIWFKGFGTATLIFYGLVMTATAYVEIKSTNEWKRKFKEQTQNEDSTEN